MEPRLATRRAGPAQLAVRITDGAGRVQSAEERSTVPMATGYHRIDVTVV